MSMCKYDTTKECHGLDCAYCKLSPAYKIGRKDQAAECRPLVDEAIRTLNVSEVYKLSNILRRVEEE